MISILIAYYEEDSWRFFSEAFYFGSFLFEISSLYPNGDYLNRMSSSSSQLNVAWMSIPTAWS